MAEAGNDVPDDGEVPTSWLMAPEDQMPGLVEDEEDSSETESPEPLPANAGMPLFSWIYSTKSITHRKQEDEEEIEDFKSSQWDTNRMVVLYLQVEHPGGIQCADCEATLGEMYRCLLRRQFAMQVLHRQRPPKNPVPPPRTVAGRLLLEAVSWSHRP